MLGVQAARTETPRQPFTMRDSQKALFSGNLGKSHCGSFKEMGKTEESFFPLNHFLKIMK